MINVGVMGYGTVGSGVAGILNSKQKKISDNVGDEVRLAKILDIADFPGDPLEKYLTKNFDDILNDPSINVVVETIGGCGVAYKFTKAALMAGKNVVTSNKAMVAAHGAEMLNIAKEHGTHYLFEAAVAGGIPIIQTLHDSYACENIQEIYGIVNGTTNFILSAMQNEGTGYDEALAEAQKLGYAEKDPTEDVEGKDSCRKIAILSSLILNGFIDYTDITTQGISQITEEDDKLAKATGFSIKLIAGCKIKGDRPNIIVSPMFVAKANPLSQIGEAYNAIYLNSDNLENIMLYGKGAGSYPTASAIVSDIVSIGLSKKPAYYEWDKKIKLEPLNDYESKFFIAIDCDDRANAVNASIGAFGAVDFYDVSSLDDDKKKVAFVTDKMTYEAMRISLEHLKGMHAVCKVSALFMVID